MILLYFVKIVPGSTNMRTRAGEKVAGVLTPAGLHRNWRHQISSIFGATEWIDAKLINIRSSLLNTILFFYEKIT